LIDGGDAGIDRSLGRPRRDLDAFEAHDPASRGNTPVTTLIKVDLPAPFSRAARGFRRRR
jgi:hypothetical protein